jgi:hypothetical protein
MGSEALKCFIDIAWHRQADPVRTKRDIHFQVSIAGLLDVDFVFISPKCGDEMIGIRLLALSNAKVVENQAKGNIESVVLKEAWSVGALVVAMFCEVEDESKLA